MFNRVKDGFIGSYKYNDYDLRNAVIAMIEATKYRKKPENKLVQLFWDADNNGFYGGLKTLIDNEHKIRSEFHHFPNDIYKNNRIKFIKSNLGLFNEKVDNDLKKLIEYINNKIKILKWKK